MRNVDGGLRHNRWEYQQESGNDWLREDWGQPQISGTPVSLPVGRTVHVFVRDLAAGKLIHWWSDDEPGSIPQSEVWSPSGAINDPAAILVGDEQHVFAVDTNGTLKHWWSTQRQGIQHESWGQGAIGRPSITALDGRIHVFARCVKGTLKHWWSTASREIKHDVWGSGIINDPAAILVGDEQHVFDVDANGALKHWWWGPGNGERQPDAWADETVGRPALIVDGKVLHSFVRRVDASLYHYWWDPILGTLHDPWAVGVTGDPTAVLFGPAHEQHVFATAKDGHLHC
jgi:hypothetical protein